MSAPLQTAIDAINPNSTDEEWTRLLAEAMNAADELTALRTQVSELRADLDVARGALERSKRHAENLGITDGSYYADLTATLNSIRKDG